MTLQRVKPLDPAHGFCQASQWRREEEGVPWLALSLLQAAIQNILSPLLPLFRILKIPRLRHKIKDVLSWQCWW